MTILPENILRLMSQADRKRYAAGQLTAEEAITRANHRSEKLEQTALENWLRREGWPYYQLKFYRARMDKRTTGPAGWPDFTIIREGRVLLGEMKVAGRKLTIEQQVTHDEFLAGGTQVQIWESYEQAKGLIINWVWTHWKLYVAKPEEADGAA